VHSDLTDAEAIRASFEEPDAFEIVFRRHYQAIRAYLQRRLGTDIGEELAAQTFLVAISKRSAYDFAYPSAKPWLFAIATNLLRHHVRDETRHLRKLAEQIPTDTHGDDEDDRLSAIRLQPLLAEAIAKLRGPDRDALLLFSLADMSYEDISVTLGIPIGTVRSRIHRARALMREQLPDLRAINAVDDEGPPDG
jgi:RNA polymerase sigma factor (sigma-70 family)